MLTAAFLSLFTSNFAFAESNVGFGFEKGSAVILCERTEPAPKSDFVKVFGHWQTYIMKKYDEGVVYLSQYAQALNKGLVIVINKHDVIADNVKEADKMLGEMNQIAEDMKVERDKSSCKVLAMGPIWLTPKK